jgi:hypothetical protein
MILINNVFIFIIFFYLFILAKIFKERNYDNFLIVFFLLLITVVYGFRFTSQSFDFMNYYYSAQSSLQSSWSTLMNRDKFFNRCFAKGVMEITHDAQYYFVFTCFVTTGMFLYFCFKYISDKAFFLLCYFTIIPSIQNNIVRQFLGVSVLLISLSFFLKGKKILCSLLLLCSVLIHSACVFFTPLYFLSNVKVTKNIITIYTVLALIIIVFHNPIISFFQLFLFSDYVGDFYGLTPSHPAHLLEILFPIIALFGIKHDNCTFANLQNNEKLSNIVKHGTLLYAMCIIMSTSFILMFSRIALLFFPLALLCVDSFAKTNPSKGLYLKIGMSSVFIVFFFATDNTPSFFIWEKIPLFSWL